MKNFEAIAVSLVLFLAGSAMLDPLEKANSYEL